MGGSITLPCKDYNHENTPVEQLDVQWRLGEQLVSRLDRGRTNYGINYRNRTELRVEGARHGDFSLTITHTQHGDSGVYQCVIRRENQEDTLGEVELKVEVPRSPSAVFVKVGEEADWLDSEPELVRWKRGDQVVLWREKGSLYVDPQFIGRVSLSRERIQEDDLSIVVKNTVHEDQGQYLCSFVKDQGIQLGVVMNLTVAGHMAQVKAAVCEVEEGWIKFEPAYADHTVLHSNYLNLEKLSVLDSGTFSVMERDSRRTASVLILQVFPTPAPAGDSGTSAYTVLIPVMMSLIILHLMISVAKRVIWGLQQKRRRPTEKQEAMLPPQNLTDHGF